MTMVTPVTTEHLYAQYQRYPLVTTDSRNIPPQSIFFSLKGETFNGNLFAGQALEKGAAIAVVDDRAVVKDQRYLLVGDALQSLQELAQHHRRQLRIPVIGITGSNGKTTTKELIHAVLSSKYSALATSGNLNNHIGVPLTLLSIRPETEIAVIEMGANHPGEIAFLCELALPTHGLITNIGKAHLEGFGSFDGVVQAKTELYAYLRKHEGTIFLNAADQLLSDHAAGIKSVTYGLVPEAGTSAKILSQKTFQETGHTGVEITFPDGEKQEILSSLFGSYNALNIIAAASIGFHFNVTTDEIAASIRAYTPVNNRSQIRRSSRNLLVLDAYNANPSSMEAALLDFASHYHHETAVILGDMLELGREANEEHSRILRLLEKLSPERVFLVGPIFSEFKLKQEWVTFPDSKTAASWFSEHPLSGASILLKGSRGIRLEEIIPYL